MKLVASLTSPYARKIRVILTPLNLLRKLPSPHQVVYEKPEHAKRLRTMQHMAEAFRAMSPSAQANNTIELATPAPHTSLIS